MRNTVDAKMPECERMLNVKEKSQAIGEFLEWLEETKKVHFRQFAVACGRCKCTTVERDEDGDWYCNECEEYTATYDVEILFPLRTEQLLAEFFRIDLNKVEQERRDMLKELRNNHARERGNLKP